MYLKVKRYVKPQKKNMYIYTHIQKQESKYKILTAENLGNYIQFFVQFLQLLRLKKKDSYKDVEAFSPKRGVVKMDRSIFI